MFKVYVKDVDNETFMNIFPIAQHKVKKLLEGINKTGIKRIYLFGSSIKDICSQDSDLDIGIVLEEGVDDFKFLRDLEMPYIDTGVDIIIFDDKKSYSLNSVEREIIEGGLLIWETKG